MRIVSSGFNDNPEAASRPFTRNRDGFVLGEGSWMFVMEREETAKERGAHIYAEVAGYASTCDAYHRVRLDESGEEPARAMTLAMKDAGVDVSQIGYLNYHGTSTDLNDRIETRAVKLALQIASALEYIHSHGVVHRDLKPENIMVDSNDHIKLIDFGIAANVGSRRLTFAKFSQTMGTPDYISPEQVKGKRGNGRSDIYALGVMLYEMLTGKVPFSGPNPFAIMNDRLLNNPVPPREINPEISPQLQEVIYRALERDPRNRYANAREMAWDLKHLDQVGVTDRTELHHWRKRRAPWVRRALFYLGLALIPIIIFSLLFLVARHN